VQGKVRGARDGLAAHHRCKLRFGHYALQSYAAKLGCKMARQNRLLKRFQYSQI
jgi:hypothetical protein